MQNIYADREMTNHNFNRKLIREGYKVEQTAPAPRDPVPWKPGSVGGVCSYHHPKYMLEYIFHIGLSVVQK